MSRPQSFSPKIIEDRLEGLGPFLSRIRSAVADESPLHPEQEVQYVNNEKGDAEAAVVDRRVGEGAVKGRIGEAGACGRGTGGRVWEVRYRDDGGRGPDAAAGGDCGHVGGGAHGWLGDVPRARGAFRCLRTKRGL
jgi:hypothetical protein